MLRFNGFEFEEKSAKLTNITSGESVQLRHKLVALLSYLIRHQSRIVSKQELLDNLWEHGQFREKSLSQSILELRKSLGDSANSPTYIRTMPNLGYQWISPALEAPKNNVFVDERPNRIRHKKTWGLGIAILLPVMLYLGYLQYVDDKNVAMIRNTDQSLSVLVLPFINHSGSSAMNWVQYGLGEMLSYDLAQIKTLNVTSPTQIKPSSLAHQLTVREIIKLLGEHHADLAIRSVFSLDKQQQVIRFELIDANGRVTNKTLKRSDITVSMPDIASELYKDIEPNAPIVHLPKYNYVPSAMHDFARGLQALQHDGYILAQHYFKASKQIDENHHWSAFYIGVSHAQAGHWAVAKNIFAHLLAQVSEQGLLANLHYQQALIAYRQGKFETSDKHLLISEKYLMAAPQNIITAQVIQLREKLALMNHNINEPLSTAQSIVNIEQFLLETPIFYSTDTLSFDNIRQIEHIDKIIRQLTVKGHKPQLFKLLVSYSLSDSLPLIEKNNVIARAVSIARELHQPYELALALIVQGRIALAQQSPESKQFFIQAKNISHHLNAIPLTQEIDFYLAVSSIVDDINIDTAQSISAAKLKSSNIETTHLTPHQQALLKSINQQVLRQ